ncbi:hypothetical protein H4R24_002016 [Coemansia sp. RSA 988]|nr:hypothetical protein H4R24_002016 [Coemansia sp. RSA 988]
MDSDSDEDRLMMIPAALKSGQTTPSRMSLISEAGAEEHFSNPHSRTQGVNSDIIEYADHSSHFQPHPSEIARARGSWNTKNEYPASLKAFPRPRSSNEYPVHDTYSASSQNNSKNSVDPRVERRKRNQYKRHGSLTLALQQEQLQQRLSSGDPGNELRPPSALRLSSDTDTGFPANIDASPMAMPVSSLPRVVYRSRGHTAPYAPDSSAHAHVYRPISQNPLSAFASSRIMSRLRSSSMMSSRTRQMHSVRTETSPFPTSRLRGSYDNDGRHDPSGLFAPVNNARLSHASSNSQNAYANSANSSARNSGTGMYGATFVRRSYSGDSINSADAAEGDSVGSVASAADSGLVYAGSQYSIQRPLSESESDMVSSGLESQASLLLDPLEDPMRRLSVGSCCSSAGPLDPDLIAATDEAGEWLKQGNQPFASAASRRCDPSNPGGEHCSDAALSVVCPAAGAVASTMSASAGGQPAQLGPVTSVDAFRRLPNELVSHAEDGVKDRLHAQAQGISRSEGSKCIGSSGSDCGKEASSASEGPDGHERAACSDSQDLPGISVCVSSASHCSTEDAKLGAGAGTDAGASTFFALPHQTEIRHSSQGHKLSTAAPPSLSSTSASSTRDLATSALLPAYNAPSQTERRPEPTAAIANPVTIATCCPHIHTRTATEPALSLGPGEKSDLVEVDVPTERSEVSYCYRERLVSNPPSNPLPCLPSQMVDGQVLTDTALPCGPASASPIQYCVEQRTETTTESATQTADNTAVCTPVASGTYGRSSQGTGEMTRVGGGTAPNGFAGALQGAAIHESPTPCARSKGEQLDWKQQQPQELADSELGSATASNALLYKEKTQDNVNMYANGVADDLHMQSTGLCQEQQVDECSAQDSDLTRHPTLVFDRSPIFRASALINVAVSTSRTTSTLGAGSSESDATNDLDGLDMGVSCVPVPVSSFGASSSGNKKDENIYTNAMFALLSQSHRLLDEPIIECRASEEHAHELGVEYKSNKKGFAKYSFRGEDEDDSAVVTEKVGARSAIPQPRTSAHPLSQATPLSNAADSPTSIDAPPSRNSLFPNVVKQQSRCLSVLLQHGPHGGIRRIGSLLITRERGGTAIALLNPAFVEMMDVQPVDTETELFLKRANIRRRSFSTVPQDSGGDWLRTMSGAIGAPAAAAGVKRFPMQGSSGPGMWWPLNDDNCSDEVGYDVHISSQDGTDAAGGVGKGVAGTLERMGSSSALSSAASRPSTAPRKGSVSSQLRLMVRAESSGNIGSGATRSNASQSSLGTTAQNMPSLGHSQSDVSDMSSCSTHASRQMSVQSASNMHTHSSGHHLADVTMRTGSGTITRSIKSISLRLLVNRLASPEGNVDSDLLTDFLNAYRFFAHPIDVMRLIIIRYLNCFAANAGTEDADDSATEETEDKCLLINGWRSNACKGAGDGVKQPATSSRGLPPLGRNDGAIVQLRVMNIIKYWIKFHPHDFRLHHRLTRLLLLFLSHIQKQPGRADFVNSIRQKLSSGKLLALDTPSFAGPPAVANPAPPAAVPPQTSSLRSSETRAPTLEAARSAIDLCSISNQEKSAGASGSAAGSKHVASNARPGTAVAATLPGLSNSVSANNLQVYHTRDGASSFQKPLEQSSDVSTGPVGRGQHVKKGSASYFRSLFHHRSNKSGSSNSGDATLGGGKNDGDVLGAYNNQSIRISQRNGGHAATLGMEPPVIGDAAERGVTMPNGDMYASDFGLVVMEALAKSGVPTPQTPVGRTLLNYSIANRNPYRINLVGIDPATCAEQLTLLEHELFARISATEFSLKGRVGDLETILQTMQGMTPDTRGQSLSGTGQSGSNNPVPNLTAMTSWFNQATYWAVLTVLSEPTSAARALVVKQLIHIAFHCFARRNYYGAFELAIALDNSAVRRLHETWQLIPPLMKDIVARILQVLQSRMNFRTYRESVKAATAGASGPDEEVFSMVAEQVKALRAKDLISTSHGSIATASGVSSVSSTGTQVGSSGLSNLVHGALFGAGTGSSGSGEEHKHHSRKKSGATKSAGGSKDLSPQLTEQDCACIIYAIRIRAASFAFSDPSSTAAGAPGESGYGHSSVPVSSSKATRGSGGHLSSSGTKYNVNSSSASTHGGSGDGNSHGSEPRSRRARSTSNSGNGPAGGRSGGGFKQGRMITDGRPLPLVPFIAVHMTDLLHADEANSTYTEEHRKMCSRNPMGPETAADTDDAPLAEELSGLNHLKRQVRCDSAAISNVNQAQPLLNMQKFRLITAMFRELHMAQRTKYPYAADKMLQQQIYNAVRNIKAQTNDIFSVVEDVALEDPMLTRPPTAYASPYGRSRTGSTASKQAAGDSESNEHASFGYPLYQIAAGQRGRDGSSLLDASMELDCTDIKDNQELEQRLYMLSKWIEPATTTR